MQKSQSAVTSGFVLPNDYWSIRVSFMYDRSQLTVFYLDTKLSTTLSNDFFILWFAWEFWQKLMGIPSVGLFMEPVLSSSRPVSL